jgi:hypothetical protein
MKDIQSPIHSKEDIPTPQQSNSLTSAKDQFIQDFSQKNTSIPFISKLSKEKKEELEFKKKKLENGKKTEIRDEDDEIDKLINKISKNNVSHRTNRGKIIVEDKVKLDFDQDVKVDINKIKSNRFVNLNNSNHSATAISTNGENNPDNHTISKYFQKTTQIGSINPQSYKNKKESRIEIKTKSNEKMLTVNTTAITNIPIKNQNSNQNNLQNNPASTTKNTNINTNTTNNVKINYTQIKRIIDTSVVNSQSDITNSDLILCILEICINSIYYGFKYSNKSKIFWENLIKKNEFKNIFINFKPETLKKYWIILSEIKDFNKAVDLINKNKELIDRKELK